MNMNTTFELNHLEKLAALIEKKGITLEKLEQIVASGMGANIFESTSTLAEREDGAGRAGKGSPAFNQGANDGLSEGALIKVDFSLPLDQMIAAGQYSWLNDNVNAKQFPVQGEGVKGYEAGLFCFEESMRSEDVMKKINRADDANPWEVARIEHLLAFGAKYPERQRLNPIVALGSVSHSRVFGRQNVAYLYRRAVGRSLHLDWWSNTWHPNYRFLAIRLSRSVI